MRFKELIYGARRLVMGKRSATTSSCRDALGSSYPYIKDTHV